MTTPAPTTAASSIGVVGSSLAFTGDSGLGGSVAAQDLPSTTAGLPSARPVHSGTIEKTPKSQQHQQKPTGTNPFGGDEEGDSVKEAYPVHLNPFWDDDFNHLVIFINTIFSI